MAKRAINVVAFEKNPSGGKDFAKATGYTILVDESVFNFMLEQDSSLSLVDVRVPGVFMTAKPFVRDDNRQSSGQSKY